MSVNGFGLVVNEKPSFLANDLLPIVNRQQMFSIFHMKRFMVCCNFLNGFIKF